MSLVCEKLKKRYGQTLALDEVSFKIESGQFVVIVGESGCGKTTLLHVLAGLLKQDSGTIMLNGTSLTELAAHERGVAMVFQEPSLYPHMTVRENIAVGFRGKKEEQRITEIARSLKIEEYLDRKPKQLSGGQKQRVALARGLVEAPKLLLLDEPFSSLDEPLRRQLRQEVKQLHCEYQTTTLYVTHDQKEAYRMADVMILMSHGKILQIGTPQQLYHQPNSFETAQFLAGGQLNHFTAVCHAGVASCGDFNWSCEIKSETADVAIYPEQLQLCEMTEELQTQVYEGNLLHVEEDEHFLWLQLQTNFMHGWLRVDKTDRLATPYREFVRKARMQKIRFKIMQVMIFPQSMQESEVKLEDNENPFFIG